MKSILKQIAEKNKEQEKAEANARQAEINDPATKDSRRSFLKNTAMGGIVLTSLMSMSFEDTIAKTTSRVPRLSSPSGLGIELNDDEMKKHLHKEDPGYFEPTPQWNEVRSYDRIWS